MTGWGRNKGVAARIASGVLPALFACQSAWGQVYFAPSRGPGTPQAPVLEQVLDEPDIEPLASFPEDSPIRAVARPVGRLRIRVTVPGGFQAEAWCTGTLIADDLVLTANHCIPGRLGVHAQAATLEMSLPSGRGLATGESFTVRVDPVETSTKFDYSLLRVFGNPASRFGHVALATQPARQNEPVFVIHYPYGREPMVTRSNCRVHRATGTDFIHSCDTSSGSSGAPVFSESSREVVGIHFAGSREANYGKQMGAVVANSATLATLGSIRKESMPGRAVADQANGVTLAQRGEAEVAAHIKAVIDLMTQTSHRSLPPVEQSHWDASKGSADEPLILWDHEGEVSGKRR